ncbi:hypothetical protein IFR05_017190 [Cadophora sp. M221]|nr:hypothetical protein IFR05_017190 [Cadophora sp. M221]
MNSNTAASQRRSNRRRARPSLRTRHTIPSEAATTTKTAPAVRLPPSQVNPPLQLCQDFHQCWQRWKSREAEKKALTELDKLQLEQDQMLFGEDADDDGSLCPAMLDVVIRLFGDIDYTDP